MKKTTLDMSLLPPIIFRGKTVISTIPPVDFVKITGDVAEKIKNTPQFKSIVPAELATVTVWYDREWYNASKYYNENVSTIINTVHVALEGLAIAKKPAHRSIISQ